MTDDSVQFNREHNLQQNVVQESIERHIILVFKVTARTTYTYTHKNKNKTEIFA